MIIDWAAELSYIGLRPLVRSWAINGSATIPTEVGHIKFNQIRALARHGIGRQFQMHDGSLVTPGNLPAYDAAGNTKDSGISSLTVGTGSVTSVALTVPSDLSVSGSPITGAGTFAITRPTQSANQVFAGPSSGGAANPTFRALVSADLPASPILIGFIMGVGTVGTNVGPMLAAPRAGSLTKCVLTVKASDPSTALTLTIKQNGVSVFSTNPTKAAGTAAGTVTTFTALTSSPLPVTQNDVFSIDITSGTANWQFTAQLE